MRVGPTRDDCIALQNFFGDEKTTRVKSDKMRDRFLKVRDKHLENVSIKGARWSFKWNLKLIFLYIFDRKKYYEKQFEREEKKLSKEKKGNTVQQAMIDVAGRIISWEDVDFEAMQKMKNVAPQRVVGGLEKLKGKFERLSSKGKDESLKETATETTKKIGEIVQKYEFTTEWGKITHLVKDIKNHLKKHKINIDDRIEFKGFIPTTVCDEYVLFAGKQFMTYVPKPRVYSEDLYQSLKLKFLQEIRGFLQTTADQDNIDKFAQNIINALSEKIKSDMTIKHRIPIETRDQYIKWAEEQFLECLPKSAVCSDDSYFLLKSDFLQEIRGFFQTVAIEMMKEPRKKRLKTLPGDDEREKNSVEMKVEYNSQLAIGVLKMRIDDKEKKTDQAIIKEEVEKYMNRLQPKKAKIEQYIKLFDDLKKEISEELTKVAQEYREQQVKEE